ncbi:MAG: type II toxin-antitoxin system RelE/ParE family toxin [Hoeflea sp.]|nr:type II toxin-antitoxin system RelE/ParE family toxin [Alphaproteobacteria bacterium]MBV1724299.1 type II toxin-antitoxin system RelE/ParE family toxin [Hoeflea sp.]MBU4546088.1 type II toxin-antitoxin system RelE/ParE family toxin [Alphaproteobacteria bacterium]MBU4553227.1 type II toxin-antitoxin system RelE/ParE family toxin [Alphaproteobacteria bacterium]MBV1759984.1 type II toxin-antitoxin system RelE/ParE family toxin [Hoeflea sp.]
MHVRFSAEARADIRNIRDFLTPTNPVAAKRVVDFILTTAYQLQASRCVGSVVECREHAKLKFPGIHISSSTHWWMIITSTSKPYSTRGSNIHQAIDLGRPAMHSPAPTPAALPPVP